MRLRVLFVAIIILSCLLRFYRLDRNPPALYWDEASLGYNAFAISQAGIDEHGERFPLARFIAFGDYKPPGYIYIDALTIKLFGLSDWAVRFPSALAGIGMVWLTYAFGRAIFGSKKIALLAAFSLAVSSWSIQLSRTAFEAHLGAFFNFLGIYLFIQSMKGKRLLLVFSLVAFMAAFYTFNANRISGPIIFAFLSALYVKDIWKKKKVYLLTLFIGVLILIPSIGYLRSPESRLRFQEVSIFTDLSIVDQANKRIERDGNTWWAKIIHNRRVLFSQLYMQHFFDHFNPRYLFLSGDRNPRLSVQVVGELYFYELPFLLLGVLGLLKKKRQVGFVLLIWIISAIIPAATARETPHALRTASVLPVYQIVIGYGVYQFFKMIKGRHVFADPPAGHAGTSTGKGTKGIIMVIMMVSWYYYLHYYFIHYPSDWAGEWQDGYKQMVSEVRTLERNYDAVVVTGSLGRPYIYFLLYNQVDPRNFLAQRVARRDWWGFWTVDRFGKYYFDERARDSISGKILFVGTPSQIREGDKIINRIYSINGEEVFDIAEI